jgi:hypothetical protein
VVGAVAFGNLDRPERHLEFVSLAPESASSWPTLRFRALRSLRSCGKVFVETRTRPACWRPAVLYWASRGDEVLDVGSDQSATASGGFREDLLIGEPDET